MVPNAYHRKRQQPTSPATGRTNAGRWAEGPIAEGEDPRPQTARSASVRGIFGKRGMWPFGANRRRLRYRETGVILQQGKLAWITSSGKAARRWGGSWADRKDSIRH